MSVEQCAETSRMLVSLDQPIPEQPAWLQEGAAAAAADERHQGPHPCDTFARSTTVIRSQAVHHPQLPETG
jgi:hypothetical protein